MTKPSRIVLMLACSVAVALVGFLFVRGFIDFPVYYAAGRSLLSGRTDLYSPDFALGRVMDYRYPPFFLVALAPLWLAPYAVAAYIWYLLSAAELAGCVLIVSRTFPALTGKKRMWLLVALATIQYFVMAMHYGNAHLLATLLLFASFYFFGLRRDVIAGLWMALAITIKLTPVLLLPYFVVKRRWKLVAAVCVFLTAINLAPSTYFGFRSNNELLERWYTHVIASQEFHEDNGPINLSLKGQLRRSMTTVDYSQRVDGDVRYPPVNFASFSRESVVYIWTVTAGVFFAAILFLIWRERRNRKGAAVAQPGDPPQDAARIPHELALMICLMLLTAPLTSKIYFIEWLWPVACLASVAVDHATRQGRVAMWVLVFVALINSVLPLLPGRSVQRMLLVLGVDFYMNCVLLVGLAFCLVVQHRGSRRRSDELRMQAPSETKTP
jgi:hypothetical protein